MFAFEPPSHRVVAALRTATSVADVARAAGVPKRSVQNVLEGSVPSLDRADEICRALDITLTIGRLRTPPGSRSGRVPNEIRDIREPPSPPHFAPPAGPFERVRDRRLAELLARLADHWETLEPGERARFGGVVAGLLDYAGARGGAEICRVVEWLGWRVIEGGALRADTDPGISGG